MRLSFGVVKHQKAYKRKKTWRIAQWGGGRAVGRTRIRLDLLNT